MRAGTSGLIGRERELDRIEMLLDAVRGGAGEALLVTGEAGVGKTVLLGAAADLAAARGMRVLRASGVEFEANLPFSGLHQLLVPVLGATAQLNPDQREALNVALGFIDGNAPKRLVVSGAVLTLLRQVAESDGLLVAVDDLPWLDRSTAGVVGFVARRLSGSRAAVLAASRTDEARLVDRSGVPELRLGPLSHEAARTLLRSRMPQLSEPLVRQVLTEARGNPLALVELPSALDGELPIEIGAASVGHQLRSLFTRRVERLPDGVRELLLLVALDSTGDMRAVHAAGPVGLDYLASAERAGLVNVTGRSHQLTFRHPLIRSAIVEASTESERQQAHLALSRVLIDQPERRAWHLGQSTLSPDEEIAALLEQAGRAVLSRGDTVAAVANLTRSSELSPLAADRSRRLALAAHIGAQANADLTNAAQLLSRARAEDADPTSALQVAIAAATVAVSAGADIDTTHRVLANAISNYADTYDPSDLLMMQAVMTLGGVARYGNRERLWVAVRETLARYQPAPPPLVKLNATVNDPARTPSLPVAELHALIAGLHTVADPNLIINVGGLATVIDGLASCEDALQRVLRDARAGGAVSSGISALVLLGMHSYDAGDWTRAVTLLEDAAAQADEHGYQLVGGTARWKLGLIAAARGDAAAAHALADSISSTAALYGVGVLSANAAQVRSMIALTEGDFETAYRHAASIVLGDAHPTDCVVLDVVEAATRTGRTDAAHEWVARAEAAGLAALSPRQALTVTAAKALAAPEPQATRLFGQALAVPASDRFQLDRARVQLAFGERLRRAQAPREAREYLAAATEVFERLGAKPWHARAADELRAAGAQPARRADWDRDALTAQEHKIATLAATGLTNKQIGQQLYLSHKTIAFHLARVFPKLGITSRAGLRDALDSLDPPAPGRS